MILSALEHDDCMNTLLGHRSSLIGAVKTFMRTKGIPCECDVIFRVAGSQTRTYPGGQHDFGYPGRGHASGTPVISRGQPARLVC